MRPEQVQLLRVRVDLGVMVMKGYFTFHKAPEQEPQYQIHFSVKPRVFVGEESYPSTEGQPAYRTASGNWLIAYTKINLKRNMKNYIKLSSSNFYLIFGRFADKS